METLELQLNLILYWVPFVIAVWIGTRVRWPFVAFFLAWLATPLATCVLHFHLRTIRKVIIPPDWCGTADLMIPIYGLILGFFAGVVAALNCSATRSNSATISAPDIDPNVPPPKTS